jgi:hypothetical protein
MNSSGFLAIFGNFATCFSKDLIEGGFDSLSFVGVNEK